MDVDTIEKTTVEDMIAARELQGLSPLVPTGKSWSVSGNDPGVYLHIEQMQEFGTNKVHLECSCRVEKCEHIAKLNAWLKGPRISSEL